MKFFSKKMVEKSTQFVATTSSNFIQIDLASSDEIKNWAQRSYFIEEKLKPEVAQDRPSPYQGYSPRSDTDGKDRRSGADAVGVFDAETVPDALRPFQPSIPRSKEVPGDFVRALSGEENEITTEGRTDWRGLNRNGRIFEIGEVKRADTLNYRTFKPEKDGLFCEKIFGPVNDWTCSCGHLKEQKFTLDHEKILLGKLKPKLCPLCLVEASSSRLRRYRMGYISLACPVTHIWYLNSRPSLFSILLKMPTKYIKKVAYYKAYSPCSSQREYMSSCLGPGGDFFDNEWEFLHSWLSGKHFLEDFPSKLTKKINRTKPIIKNLYKDTTENLSVHQRTVLANTDTRCTFRADRRFVQQHWGGQLKQSAMRRRSRPIMSPLGLAMLNLHVNNGARIPTKGPCTTESPARTLSRIGKTIASMDEDSEAVGTDGIHVKKFPEFPNWLVNTGAQALLNQLESRNWAKEIEKLEHESNFQVGTAVWRGLNDGDASTDGHNLHGPSSTPVRVSYNEVRNDSAQTADSARDNFFEKRLRNRLRILKLLKSFQKSGLSFSGMIFRTLPVLPPELRPIIQLGAGQLASSDVNDLYRRIISRNNRLKYYLYETHFVEFLVRSEQQLVQLAVDALLENGKTTSVRHTSGQKRLYKSLSDRIGGKQGRFRMNLLGKRVDYSGRSVIVVGPRLKLFQCGLPYEMGIELFQPFLLRHMLELQLAKTIRGAKTILRFNKPLARQLLHHVVKAHPILLNRAPTLHRLGIQAFQPVLVFGRAIHLHPLVCPAFNADFDGDQMAVHIPLSPQARVEARLLLLASGNWLSSSTGQPNVLPSQDMVLGFYYLTIEKYGYQKGRGNTYSSLTDVMQAYELGLLDLHSQVWIKWSGPFTSDICIGFSSPQSHKEIAQDQRSALHSVQRPDEIRETSSGHDTRTTGVQLDNLLSRHHNNLSLRFRRETDQPIELRVNKKLTITKIYSAYQWQEDSDETNRISFIRTTPGRVLMNQIFQKYL